MSAGARGCSAGVSLAQAHGEDPPALPTIGQVCPRAGRENCCPLRTFWKVWLQRLQNHTATASTITVRCQDFNSSSCALFWLPAELDLGSPLLQPDLRGCCLCSQTWGGASHAVPGYTSKRSNQAPAAPARSQQLCRRVPQDHLCPSLQIRAVSTPVDVISCSGTLPCSVQGSSARPRSASQVRSWRQATQSAARQSLPSLWEELHDKGG